MSTKVKSLIAKHRTWLATHAEHVFDQGNELLEADPADASLEAFVHVPSDLSFLALHHGVKGSLSVIDEDESGWADINMAIHLRAWALRTYQRSQPGSEPCLYQPSVA